MTTATWQPREANSSDHAVAGGSGSTLAAAGLGGPGDLAVPLPANFFWCGVAGVTWYFQVTPSHRCSQARGGAAAASGAILIAGR